MSTKKTKIIMKLENLGVQEMDSVDLQKTEGG